MLTLIHKIIGGCMLAVIAILLFKWQLAASDARKFETQAVKANAELQRISSAKAEQRTVTTGNIAKAREDQAKVRVIVKRIRSAPNPANCGTPALDEARNVL